VRTLEACLSSTERERARRLRFDRDRQRYVVRRGLLRVILGRYLGAAPEELEFQYGDCGKPELDPSTSDGSLRFNLSYTYDLALYAVARGQELGVDVERIRDKSYLGLATRYFSAAERAELRGLPVESRAQGFFNGWSRKESYVKALGTGLVTRLDSFTVNLTPGEPARLLSGAPGWSLAGLDVPAGHAAALTVGGTCECIVQGGWSS